MARTPTKAGAAAKKAVSGTTSRKIDLKFLNPEVLNFSGLNNAQIQNAIRDTLNFNNYFHTYKDGIEWLAIFAKTFLSAADLRYFKMSEEWQASITVCTLAKMINAKCDIGEKNVEFVKSAIDRMVRIGQSKASNKPKAVSDADTTQVNVAFSNFMATVDEAIDNWPEAIDAKAIIGNFSVSKADLAKAATVYKEILDFTTEAFKDREMVIGFRFLKTVADRKKYLSRLETLVADLSGMAVRNAAVIRKPRTKKAKSADQLVTKVKYQPDSREYGLVSLHPRDLIGAKMAVLFNTRTRTLTLVKSLTGFSVTGTSLTNADDANTFKKILRKPSLVLGDFHKVTKTRVEKVFTEIKTTAQPGSSRLNEDTVIMKIYL